MECRPKTGRSHQIRVHLLKNDIPIIGDKRYGKKSLKNLPDSIADLASAHQMLHAASIKFELPGGKNKIELNCPLSENFDGIRKLAFPTYRI